MISTTAAKLAFTSFFLLVSFARAQEPKLPEEKELEVVNFKSIKKVLQHDGLADEARAKGSKVKVLKKAQKAVEVNRYAYPDEDEFWGFLSEYWLVKNAQLLNWDFEKPDYGVEVSLKRILEKLGYYQKSFKVLFLNSPEMIRGSLPGAHGEMILLLSVPFIRSLDLSKLEISLLLLEDFFRLEGGYFRKAVGTDKLRSLAGTNFHGSKPDPALVPQLLKRYDSHLREKGYTFQQQFEVTKKMDTLLKSSPDLWNTYYRLLGKIDRFVKGNAQYKNYLKLYPSPEMQIKWMSPEEKVL